MVENNIIEQVRLARSIVEDVCDEEIDALDCIPENLQYSDRAETMGEIVSLLEEAAELIIEAENNIER